MQTIAWSDVNHMRDTGPVQICDRAIMISDGHIARWMEDPDGRFELVDASTGDATAELGKFYPSL